MISEEQAALIDRIIALADELSDCITPKIGGERIDPAYWGKRRKQEALLQQLRELNDKASSSKS